MLALSLYVWLFPIHVPISVSQTADQVLLKGLGKIRHTSSIYVFLWSGKKKKLFSKFGLFLNWVQQEFTLQKWI